MKHALLATFFGKLRDRFCEYQKPLSVDEKLERASLVPGVKGVELIFPDECRESVDLGSALTRSNLLPAAINVNLKGDRSFVDGALSSPDRQTRRKAVRLILEAKEFARNLGCERVTCAPLADGYDYPFQVNYSSAWKGLVECLREAAEAIPEVALHLEHKPGDPRVTGFLDSSAKVLRLCREIGRPGVGITFNVGHSLFEGGWPAPEFSLVADAGIPCYIHYNDGTVRWDWDLMAGSVYLWEWIECLYYMKKSGYDGWFTADILPLRQDAVEVFASNVRMASRIWSWLDSVDLSAFRERLYGGDPCAGVREIARWVCPQS